MANIGEMIPSGSMGGYYNPEIQKAQQSQGSSASGGSDYIGWQDIFLPGFSIANKMFDFTGSSAAQQQYQSQLALNQQAQEYNAQQAQAQRDFEERMSNTTYQRMKADLEAAGMNPYLVMANASGAGVPSGSAAQSSSGSADMANNKLTAAAGILAVILRMILTKH